MVWMETNWDLLTLNSACCVQREGFHVQGLGFRFVFVKMLQLWRSSTGCLTFEVHQTTAGRPTRFSPPSERKAERNENPNPVNPRTRIYNRASWSRITCDPAEPFHPEKKSHLAAIRQDQQSPSTTLFSKVNRTFPLNLFFSPEMKLVVLFFSDPVTIRTTWSFWCWNVFSSFLWVFSFFTSVFEERSVEVNSFHVCCLFRFWPAPAAGREPRLLPTEASGNGLHHLRERRLSRCTHDALHARQDSVSLEPSS